MVRLRKNKCIPKKKIVMKYYAIIAKIKMKYVIKVLTIYTIKRKYGNNKKNNLEFEKEKKFLIKIIIVTIEKFNNHIEKYIILEDKIYKTKKIYKSKEYI